MITKNIQYFFENRIEKWEIQGRDADSPALRPYLQPLNQIKAGD
jgi:hypothetical protein